MQPLLLAYSANPRIKKMNTLMTLLTVALILFAWSSDRVAVQGQTSPPTTQPPAAEKQVKAAVFAPDGKRIIVTSNDGKVRIWDARTGQALPTGTNGTIQIWDLASGKPVSPRYSPDAPDKMPMVGTDNFKVLQDQIDALEKRVRELEKKLGTSGH